jgi:hypothetical protein
MWQWRRARATLENGRWILRRLVGYIHNKGEAVGIADRAASCSSAAGASPLGYPCTSVSIGRPTACVDQFDIVSPAAQPFDDELRQADAAVGPIEP